MLTDIETDDLLNSLKGWLSKNQIENIHDAVKSGKLNPDKFRSLPKEYVAEKFDNGGFTPREQYALGFANKY